MGQMRVVGGAVEKNLGRATAMIAEAAGHGADLIVLPEVLDCGWCDESAREHAGAIPGGSSYQALAQAAVSQEIHVCAGLTERDGEEIYNSGVLIGPEGALLLKHRKVNELAIAKEIYSTGKNAEAVCDTPFGKLGLMICADGFFVGEVLTRSLAGLGAQVILSPCAWAVPPEHDQEKEPYGDLWRDVYGRVAKEAGIWISGTSNVGEVRHGAWSGHPCIGCSMLVGPDGEVRVSGSYGKAAEEILYAEVAW
jgi:predicted amidohydrolase